MAGVSLQQFIKENAPAGGSSDAPKKVPLSEFIQTQKNAPPPAAPAPAPGSQPGALQKFGSFVGSLFKGVAGTESDIADKTAEQFKQAGENVVENVSAGADEMSANAPGGATRAGNPLKFAAGAGRAALGATGGFAQALFAPVTASIQELSDKASQSPCSLEMIG